MRFEDEEADILDSWDEDFFSDISLGVGEDTGPQWGSLRPRGFYSDNEDDNYDIWY